MIGRQGRAYRLDFLVHYSEGAGRGPAAEGAGKGSCKRESRRGEWVDLELNGYQHRSTPNDDAERADGLGIPQLAYDNEKTRYLSFFDTLVDDVRQRAALARAWRRDRCRSARELRRKREAEARKRREAL